MSNIKTGIDRLVDLLNERKKLSTQQASNLLNIEKDVVEEWAELLEQEGIAKITFKFSKTYIELKSIDSKKVKSSVKQVYSERDAFQRRIESTIRELNKDTSGFEKLKTEYNKIQKSIKGELDTIREQTKELEKFDNLKNNVEADIKAQKKDYEKFVDSYKKYFSDFENNYKNYIKKIIDEENKIEKFQKKIESIRKEKEEIKEIISASVDKMNGLSKEIDKQLRNVRDSERLIEHIKKDISKLSDNLSSEKEEVLVNLVKKMGTRSDDILARQDSMISDAREKVKIIQSYATAGKKTYEDFSSLFNKKLKTVKLIDDIDKEKEELLEELESLKRKVGTFSILSNYAKVKKEIGDIEKVIKKYEDRKNSILGKIKNLVTMLS